MNSQHIIDSLPEQSKRMVLYSLVGSINSSIINTASSVVAALTRDEVEFKDYNARDVEHLMEEPDWRQDNLLAARRMYRVGENLRDQLIELTNDDAVGALSESIAYRSKPAPVSNVDRAKLKATLIATRIVKANVSDADIERFAVSAMERQAQDNARSAERVAERAGAIEWVIDHVFHNPEYAFESQDNIEELPRATKANLFDIIRNKIDSERLVAVNEILQSRRNPRYTITDATLLADCADMADELDAHLEEATID